MLQHIVITGLKGVWFIRCRYSNSTEERNKIQANSGILTDFLIENGGKRATMSSPL